MADPILMLTDQTVTMVRGQTRTETMTVTDASLVAVDITGASIYLTVKHNNNGTVLIRKTVGNGITLTDPTNGIYTYTIDPVDTDGWNDNIYYYDILIEDIPNADDRYYHVERSKFDVDGSLFRNEQAQISTLNALFSGQQVPGYMARTGEHGWETHKYNHEATTNPGVTNDIDEGYVVGSRWINLTSTEEYVCMDNSDGAAVWEQTTGGGAGGGDVSGGGTSTDNALPRWDGTDGTTIQDSSILVDDSDNVTGVVGLTMSGALATPTSITTSGNLTADDILTNTDDTYDIGAAATGFKNAYLTGDIVMDERADHAVTPAAGKGQLWVKSDTPNVLVFTDDAGTDTTLGAGGGSGDLLADGTVPMTAAFDFAGFALHDPGDITDANGNELISFSETTSAVNEFTIQNAATGNDPSLYATGGDANIGIYLTPKGTGNVTLGTMTLDADQSIGAGQDNYVLTYDDGTGLISLEAAAGGGSGDLLADGTVPMTAAFDFAGFALHDPGDITDANGNELLTFTTTASAVNHLNIKNNATTNQPRITAEGDDANIGIHLEPQGSGGLLVYNDSGTIAYSFNTNSSFVNRLNFVASQTGSSVGTSAAGSDTNIAIAVTPKGTGNILLPLSNDGTSQVHITKDAVSTNYWTGLHLDNESTGAAHYSPGILFSGHYDAGEGNAPFSMAIQARYSMPGPREEIHILDGAGAVTGCYFNDQGDVYGTDIYASDDVIATGDVNVSGNLVSGSGNLSVADTLEPTSGSVELGSSTQDWYNAWLNGAVVFADRADHPETPTTGLHQLWVRTSDNALVYTDEAGTDTDLTAAGGGGMSDLVDDTTPQLGGTLDFNSNHAELTQGTSKIYTDTDKDSYIWGSADDTTEIWCGGLRVLWLNYWYLSAISMYPKSDDTYKLGTETIGWAQLHLTDYLGIQEQASAPTNLAGHGRLWVKNTTPCELWFTDDAGASTKIV